MSLILDALKKLDRERASRRQGMPDLAAEVLRSDSPPPRKKVPMYLLAVALTALATAGITYAIFGKPGFLPLSPPPPSGIPPAAGKQVASAAPAIPPVPGQKDSPTPPALDSKAQSTPPAPTTPPASPKKQEAASTKAGAPSKPSPPAPARPPAAGRRVAAGSPKPGPPAKPSPGTTPGLSVSVDQVSPAPPESGVSAPRSSSAPAHSPVSSPQISPSPLSPEPARGLESGAKPELSKVPAKIGGGPPVSSPGEKDEIVRGTPREIKAPPAKASKPGEPVAGSSAADPPPLRISGIVWNEEPSNRRAVINGSLLSEGSTIEGVKVVEIFPTKVQFLYQGAYFEKSIF